MSNEENLIPVRTKEEARNRGRAGGIASGEARRRKRDARKIMLEILASKPSLDRKTLANLQQLGIYGKGRGKDRYDIEMIIAAAVTQKAMRGDIKAYRAILETIGEDVRTRMTRESSRMYQSDGDDGLTIVYDYDDAEAEDDDQ